MEAKMPLHPGEPEFRIRSQDALAPNAVEAWANFADLAAKAAGVEHLHEQAEQARAVAAEMREWQAEHPDLVKWPD
jgi:hypothetical protein